MNAYIVNHRACCPDLFEAMQAASAYGAPEDGIPLAVARRLVRAGLARITGRDRARKLGYAVRVIVDPAADPKKVRQAMA